MAKAQRNSTTGKMMRQPATGKIILAASGDPCCPPRYAQARYCKAREGHHAANGLANYWFLLYVIDGVTYIKDENDEYVTLPHYFLVDGPDEDVIYISGSDTTCTPGEQDEAALTTTDSCCDDCPLCADAPPAFDLTLNSIGTSTFYTTLGKVIAGPNPLDDFSICMCRNGDCRWTGSAASPFTVAGIAPSDIRIVADLRYVFRPDINPTHNVFLLNVKLEFPGAACTEDLFIAGAPLFGAVIEADVCNDTFTAPNRITTFSFPGCERVGINGTATITPRETVCDTFTPKYQGVMTSNASQCGTALDYYRKGDGDLNGTWDDLAATGDNTVPLIDTETNYVVGACTVPDAFQFDWNLPAHSIINLSGINGPTPNVTIQLIDADDNILDAWYGVAEGPCGSCCGWPRVLTFTQSTGPTPNESLPYTGGTFTLYLTNCGENDDA